LLAASLALRFAIRLAQRSNAVTNIAAFLAVPVDGRHRLVLVLLSDLGAVPSPTGPRTVADTSTSAAYIVRGLIGLLVDQQFGVLTTAPILLLAAPRNRPFVQAESAPHHRADGIIIAYTITVASYAMWWAGSAAPARFLVSILPLAALPIAVVWSRSRAFRVCCSC
jgi:hypothetical protein